MINVYNLQTGAFAGTMTNQISGAPLQFDGLWGMLFLGNNLYFTAGLGDESHGLFGDIVPVQLGPNESQGRNCRAAGMVAPQAPRAREGRAFLLLSSSDRV